MQTSFLPIQTILFQILFLLIAIALEAYIFHRKLKLNHKTSIEYAISINLLSTIIGWLSFFFMLPLLSNDLKFQLINYILFNSFLTDQLPRLNILILMIGFTVFFVTFLIKLNGIYLLEILLDRDQHKESPKEQRTLKQRYKKRQMIHQLTSRNGSSKATVILVANALSHSAILIILLIRSF